MLSKKTELCSKKITSLAFLILTILISTLTLAPEANAHLFLTYNNMTSSWQPTPLNSEFAAINYNSETEKIAFAVTTPPAKAGVLIFPIPNENATISKLKNYPQFTGVDVRTKAEENLAVIYENMFAAQIYPLYYLSLISPRYNVEDSNKSKISTVEESEKVDLMSWEAEVISSEKLDSYLAFRKINLTQQELQEIMLDYKTKNYSFVIATYYNSSSSITRGFFITFQTDKPFYPQKLKSLTQEKSLARLYLVDKYAINNSNSLTKITETEEKIELTHYYDSDFKPNNQDFFNSTKKKIEFTKVTIPAMKTYEDLWFDEQPAKNNAFLSSIAKHPFIWGFLIYLALSCLASMIAAVIVFKDNRPKIFEFLFFGVTNLLTLIAFWIRAYFKDVESSFTEKEESIQVVELTTGKRVALAVPIIILVLTVLMIPLSLILELNSIFFPLFMTNIFIFLLVPAMTFLILILWGAFNKKKILLYNLVFTLTFFLLLLISLFGFMFFF